MNRMTIFKIGLIFLFVLMLFASCVPPGGISSRSNVRNDPNPEQGIDRAVVREKAEAAGKRYALIIGNAAYREHPLRNPVNDAREMARVLASLGFDVRHYPNADHRTMETAVRDLNRRLRSGGVGLFYYAGHGMQVGGVNYLIPIGADIASEADIKYKAVNVNQVLDLMAESGNRLNIVILDACRDNPLGRGFKRSSGAEGLAPVYTPGGRGAFVAFATAPGQTAADGSGVNGVFTGHLLENLARPGWPLERVFKQTREAVMATTGRRQVPWESSSIVGDFYFNQGETQQVEAGAGLPPTSSSPLPAGPVSPSAPAPSSVSADLAQLVKQREQSRAEWSAWQSRMESEFRKLEGYEKQSLLSEAEKESGWASFLSSYASDNEFSDQDEALRQKARARESYWKQKAYEAEQAMIAAQRQKLDQERQRLSEEQERQRLEEERRRLAEEKARLEEDRRQAALAAQRRKLEEERRKVEEERSRLNRPSGPSFTNSIGQKFVLIPAGSFMMGSKLSPEEVKKKLGGDLDWYKDEHPRHRVTLRRDFYMQTTEVTQGQWQAVMGSNPSNFSSCGDDCPVERVSWDEAQEFIRRLNQTEGTDKYRLPTEAEWEYACRAGSTTRWSFGDDENRLGDYAWYGDNSDQKTHPVARKKPNAWGLYDMHGNVWEWCSDWYGDYPSGSVTDPASPSSGSYRVNRGGSWGYYARRCRSAYRDRFDPGFRGSILGFRLARTK